MGTLVWWGMKCAIVENLSTMTQTFLYPSDSGRATLKSMDKAHQQDVKTSHGPPRGVMGPLVVLVHPDLSRSTFSVQYERGWIRMDRSGPGGTRGPQPRWVDHSAQDHLGPRSDIFLMASSAGRLSRRE